MNQPSAFATFKTKGEHVYRTSAYIQWGTSSASLGSCLLLNPGSSTLFRERPAPHHSIMGQTTLDPTMHQLVKLTEAIYQPKAEQGTLEGRLHIYNLFSLQNPQAKEAVSLFEALLHAGDTALDEHITRSHELVKHPWMLLGWGCMAKASRPLHSLKEMWLREIAAAGVPTFGKPCATGKNYYHPCPQLHAMRELILRDLVALHDQACGSVRG
ncbi:hypothetical protein AN963_17225 [Brevibacillus choshinensis]|uniref:DUF1643 domain-containing protein n=1 Tax=Brevibacillus choshinensis TaxID=54911 RepID=A0ABR5N7Q2_BRECH|nr:hypothetical protein [Brevibacillus choshinensis]KQL46658.1 hypothetical protein AN963_17225 [Brevibacillus choshinensis]